MPATPTSADPWGGARNAWKSKVGDRNVLSWNAAASGLTPEDLNFFNTSLGRADFGYLQALEQNRHNRASARLGFTTQSRELKEQFRKQRESLYGQVAARGIAGSPYGRHQYTEFENARNTALGALRAQYLQQLAGLTTADQQLLASRNQNYADIHNAKAARQAAAAIIKNNAGGF